MHVCVFSLLFVSVLIQDNYKIRLTNFSEGDLVSGNRLKLSLMPYSIRGFLECPNKNIFTRQMVCRNQLYHPQAASH